MSRDHIIPRFILRGFAINPSESKKRQKVMIYDKQTSKVLTVNIDDAYVLKNFNSPETEEYLANEYESKVADLYQRISSAANENRHSLSLSCMEYEMLIRFFAIMWRRNDIHMETIRKMALQLKDSMKLMFGDRLEDMFDPTYQGLSFEERLNTQIDDIKTAVYTQIIRETTNADPTVAKTMEHYSPLIVVNKSKIHFLLHNTYATLQYMVRKGQTTVNACDYPRIMIYPISKTICICLIYGEKKSDGKGKVEIPIETCDSDEDIKSLFIHGYITSTAKSYVVDNTNLLFVKAE